MRAHDLFADLDVGEAFVGDGALDPLELVDVVEQARGLGADVLDHLALGLRERLTRSQAEGATPPEIDPAVAFIDFGQHQPLHVVGIGVHLVVALGAVPHWSGAASVPMPTACPTVLPTCTHGV